MRLHHLLLCNLVAAAACTLAPADPAPVPPAGLVPVETFFADPYMRSPVISPDGHYLAFLAKLGTGRVGVALTDLTTGKTEPLVGGSDENYGFIHWKNPDYLLFGGDVGGNESLSLRSIRISTRKVLELSQSFRERYFEDANQADIADLLRFDPNHILVFGNKEQRSSDFRLFNVDIRTGERNAHPYDPEKDASDLVVDNAGNVRARSRLLGEKSIFEARRSDGLYKKIHEFPANDPGWTVHPEVGADNETLYLLTRDSTDTNALQTYNLRTGVLSPILFQVPADGEINDVLLSFDRKKLYGVLYTTDKAYYHWFDDSRARLQAQIDAALPGAFNTVTSRTPDEKVLVIHSGSDTEPGAYYVLDLRRTALMKIGQYNPFIKPAQMRPMQPITYTARDGLVIHGYLTLPAGASGKPMPLILNPHGGPYGIRDDWGFNPEVQFLANRGYAVLQVNYRGSGGYGHKFLLAGKHEWGRKMQDDLTDAVHWAIDQHIADPEHVAIYGASYGGYAALAGVTFTPELFQCGVNYVGVSDLAVLNRHTIGGDRGMDIYFADWIQNDALSMHERSPVNFVERIRVPTLHAYGENDPRVDIDNWKELKSQLDKYQKPYEFIRVEAEGHGFHKEENRVKFYRAMEAFFAVNLGDHPGKVKILPTKVIELPAREGK
jgi:dipeptidyl aminopeptidase/acylaminoacyl peptidase